jgi:glc operon protein GlcG
LTDVPSNPLDVIPEKMSFSVPYGAPISLARAQAAIGAVTAEAEKHGWALNVAVDDSGANLVAGSIAIAEHKARASVKFRRPTKAWEQGIQKKTININSRWTTSSPRAAAFLIEDGKLIGGIGCSGGTASQDEAACLVGAATINK